MAFHTNIPTYNNEIRKDDYLKANYPLHTACRDGDSYMLEIMLKTTRKETSHLHKEDCYNGWTPPHWAAYFGHVECLRKLRERGCDLGRKSTISLLTPLHLAALASRLDCLYFLVGSGLDLGAKDSIGETALHKAARNGSLNCASVLAGDSTILSARNSCGQTASQVAEQCGHSQLAGLLRPPAPSMTSPVPSNKRPWEGTDTTPAQQVAAKRPRVQEGMAEESSMETGTEPRSPAGEPSSHQGPPKVSSYSSCDTPHYRRNHGFSGPLSFGHYF